MITVLLLYDFTSLVNLLYEICQTLNVLFVIVKSNIVCVCLGK